MNRPRASIVICTLGGSQLEQCLDSLAKEQSTSSSELIVVDNRGTPETKEVVRSLAGHLRFPVRYVIEPELGSSNARNCGIRAAEGDVILFTDDDVLVEPGWIDSLMAAFDDPAVGGAGGRVLPGWPFPPPPWMQGPDADALSLPDYGADAKLLDRECRPIGANMAIRAAVAKAGDPLFNPSLGHRGANIRMAHEEWHVFGQIMQNHRVVYCPDAVVVHRILPERISRQWIRHDQLLRGVGHARRVRMEGTADRGKRRNVTQVANATVRVVRWRARRPTDSPAEAANDFAAHYKLGFALETALGRFPTLVERLATRLA